MKFFAFLVCIFGVKLFAFGILRYSFYIEFIVDLVSIDAQISMTLTI